MPATFTTADTPIGELTLVAEDGALTGVYFPHHWYKPDPATFGARCDADFDQTKRELAEYFAGERQRFDVALAPLTDRGDAFQRQVWALVDEIPYGETATYGDLARRLGDVRLAKDVGAAVGRNPLCVLVPCHRVVGRDGRLTGYAGGLSRKRFLLDLEELEESVAVKLF